MPLALNSIAPDFTLPSVSGRSFSLSVDMQGKACILYFYPRDFTHVCTKEACEFRDSFNFFKDFNVAIVGISDDDIATHRKFKEEFDIPFELLSDIDGKVATLYGARVPLVKFTRRVTYLLDAQHRIVAVYENWFSSKKHIQKMIGIIKR